MASDNKWFLPNFQNSSKSAFFLINFSSKINTHIAALTTLTFFGGFEKFLTSVMLLGFNNLIFLRLSSNSSLASLTDSSAYYFNTLASNYYLVASASSFATIFFVSVS